MTNPMTDNSAETELKPCPFCGGKPELVTNAPERWVHCLQCKASGDTATHESTAVEKWNTRSTAATVSREAAVSAIVEILRGNSFALNGSCHVHTKAGQIFDAILSLTPIGSGAEAMREALRSLLDDKHITYGVRVKTARDVLSSLPGEQSESLSPVLVQLVQKKLTAESNHCGTRESVTRSDAHGDGYCGCTERCKDRDNCQYDVKPSPIEEACYHLAVVLMTPHLIDDSISLEHIKSAHELLRGAVKTSQQPQVTK